MKNRAFAISFLLLSDPAAAADFRTIDFAQSCAEVESAEKQLGSVADGELQRDYQVYQGVHLDRVAKIHYNCSNDGKLTRGIYIYSFNNMEEAKAFFGIVEPTLIGQHGMPKVDGSSKEYTAMMSELGGQITDNDKYMRYWEAAGLKILLSAMRPSIHSEEAVVGIDYSPMER